MTRFLDVFERFKQHRLTAEEVGELLDLPARHFLRHISSYSPERRGRMERVFGTL